MIMVVCLFSYDISRNYDFSYPQVIMAVCSASPSSSIQRDKRAAAASELAWNICSVQLQPGLYTTLLHLNLSQVNPHISLSFLERSVAAVHPYFSNHVNGYT